MSNVYICCESLMVEEIQFPRESNYIKRLLQIATIPIVVYGHCRISLLTEDKRQFIGRG